MDLLSIGSWEVDILVDQSVELITRPDLKCRLDIQITADRLFGDATKLSAKFRLAASDAVSCVANVELCGIDASIPVPNSAISAAEPNVRKRLADHARLEVPRHQSVDILRGPSVGHAN